MSMHPLLEQYQHTLLGRLRTKILSSISGSTERLPTDRELYSELMAEWKKNASSARIKFFLLHLRKTQRISISLELSRQQVRASIREIAKKSPLWGLFAETVPQGGAENLSVGCLVMGHTRPSDEPGYYAAITSEDDFPNCGFVSIVPSRYASASLISQLGSDGWKDLTYTEAGKNPAVCMALIAIQHNLPGTVSVPIEQIRYGSEDEPPLDPECMRRLELVLRNKMRTAKATVDLSTIRLFDESFGLSLKPDEIAQWAAHLRTDNDDLLIYWNGEYFVSSDDYYGYLSYKLLGRRRVPVVIMGEFPTAIAEVERRGTHKLLPPITVLTKSVTPGVTPEFISWRTRELERRRHRIPTPADLLARWSALADVLDDDTPTEREIHAFLTSNPIILGAHWDEVESEVRFGREFRADLLLRAHRALPRVRLVELERPTHRLFTNKLRETAEVTHAIQQVNDWVRWCRQHPDDPVIAAGRGVTPDGMVVIGRSRFLSERERETLAHNNQGRDVEVITYDELLDDFGTLILHRLDDTDATESL
jgi:hypothetical protein